MGAGVAVTVGAAPVASVGAALLPHITPVASVPAPPPPVPTPNMLLSLMFSDPDGTQARRRSSEIREIFPSTVSVRHGMSYAQDRFDLVLDWAKHKPEAAQPWAEQLTELSHLVEERSAAILEIHSQNVGADYDKMSAIFKQRGLDQQEKRMVEIADGIKKQIKDKPWASQEWKQIAATRIAEMEPEIAQQLGVSLGQVQRSINFLISGDAVPTLLIEIVDGELRLDPLPLISDEFTQLAIDRIVTFSPSWACDLRLANDSSLTYKWDSMSGNSRSYLEKALGYEGNGLPGPIHFWFYEASVRGGRHEIALPEEEAMIQAYSNFLTRLLELRAKINLLHPSGLKSAALKLIDNRFTRAREELLNLPELLDGVRRENQYRLPKSELAKMGTVSSAAHLEFLNLVGQVAGPVLQSLLFDPSATAAPSVAVERTDEAHVASETSHDCPRLLTGQHQVQDGLMSVPIDASTPDRAPVPVQRKPSK